MKTVALLTVALLVLAVPAAMAAGSFDKSSVAANTDVDVTLNVTVEEVPAYNDRVVLEIPSGFRVLACPATTDFSCTPSRTSLTWKRTTPGTPVPLDADHFPFRLHTIDRAGQYVFAVHQFYSDNTTADSAAKLAVAAPAPAARPTTTTTTIKKAAAIRSASFSGSRQAPAVTAVTDPAWLTDSEHSDAPPIELGTESKARPSTGMVVAGLVAAVAAGGVFWLRRRAAAAR